MFYLLSNIRLVDYWKASNNSTFVTIYSFGSDKLTKCEVLVQKLGIRIFSRIYEYTWINTKFL